VPTLAGIHVHAFVNNAALDFVMTNAPDATPLWAASKRKAGQSVDADRGPEYFL